MNLSTTHMPTQMCAMILFTEALCNIEKLPWKIRYLIKLNQSNKLLCTQEAVICSYQKWSYIGKQANGIEKSSETDSNIYMSICYMINIKSVQQRQTF